MEASEKSSATFTTTTVMVITAPSPFKHYENALLRFQIPTGKVVVNRVGNRVQEVEPVEVRAMLRPSKNLVQINYYVGEDQTSELLTGYLTEPLTMPRYLHPPADGEAEIKTAIGITRKGTFKMLPNTQSPYIMGTDIPFLTKILGIFKRT